MTDSTEVQVTEIDALKEMAQKMGINHSPNIGVEKLRAKIKEAKGSTLEEQPDSETLSAHQEAWNEDMRLIRIRVTNMNEANRASKGMIFQVGNPVVGIIKKYVPFGAEDGWHVPNIMYKHIKNADHRISIEQTDAKGQPYQETKMIKSYAVEVLEPLTPKQLEELEALNAKSVGGAQ